MGFDRYREDLEAVLRVEAREGWARALRQEAPAPAGDLDERADDLVSGTGIRVLIDETRETRPGEPGAWLRACVARLAAVRRTPEETREIRGALSALQWPDERGTSWREMPWRLATLDAARSRDAFAEPLDLACEAAAGPFSELATARVDAHPEELRDPWPHTHARGRESGRMRELAGRLLAETENAFESALPGAAELTRSRFAEPGPAVEYPWFRAGGGLVSRMPAPDLGLARYVASGLGLGEAPRGRLKVSLGERGRPAPEPGVHVLEPGRDVRVVASQVGRPHDYRSLLAGLGAGLALALLEERDGLEAWLIDPALAHWHGALLEGLAGDPAWIERATRQPPEGEWLRVWTAHELLRVRELAATVVAGPPLPDELPLADDGEEATRALGFRQPPGVRPWSIAPMEAADRLAGRLAAYALVDRLAARWGTQWFARPAAGRLLRDLWAAPHGTLEQAMRDLRLGELSIEPYLALSARATRA